MPCCGSTTLGTEDEPLVLGEPTDGTPVHVMFLSPIVPGAAFGSEGWVTGSHVDPYLEADVLAPYAPAVPLAAAAPTKPAKTKTTSAQEAQ